MSTKDHILAALEAYSKGAKGRALDEINLAIEYFEAVSDCGLPSDVELDRQIACRLQNPHEAVGDYLLLARDTLLKELGVERYALMPVVLALKTALNLL